MFSGLLFYSYAIGMEGAFLKASTVTRQTRGHTNLLGNLSKGTGTPQIAWLAKETLTPKNIAAIKASN